MRARKLVSPPTVGGAAREKTTSSSWVCRAGPSASRAGLGRREGGKGKAEAGRVRREAACAEKKGRRRGLRTGPGEEKRNGLRPREIREGKGFILSWDFGYLNLDGIRVLKWSKTQIKIRARSRTNKQTLW